MPLASTPKSPLLDVKGKAKEGKTGKAARAKPKGPRGRDAMVKKVLNANGEIWILDVTGLPQPELQDMVRGFLTAHYREYPQQFERPFCNFTKDLLLPGLVTGNSKISAPFKRIPRHQAELFAEGHVPDGFTFPDDPSHWTKDEALCFLNLIITCQESDPTDVFQFQFWLDPAGNLQPSKGCSDADDVLARKAHLQGRSMMPMFRHHDGNRRQPRNRKQVDRDEEWVGDDEEDDEEVIDWSVSNQSPTEMSGDKGNGSEAVKGMAEAEAGERNVTSHKETPAHNFFPGPPETKMGAGRGVRLLPNLCSLMN